MYPNTNDGINLNSCILQTYIHIYIHMYVYIYIHIDVFPPPGQLTKIFFPISISIMYKRIIVMDSNGTSLIEHHLSIHTCSILEFQPTPTSLWDPFRYRHIDPCLPRCKSLEMKFRTINGQLKGYLGSPFSWPWEV